MTSLKNKRVTVMGLGLHGGALGTIKWLHEQGAKLLVTDLKPEKELAATMEKLKDYKDIMFVLGEHREQDFTDTDLVIQNPAVPRTSKYIQFARERGVAVEMDSSLFWQHCPSQQIIGITGSKGKTTTATAIATVLKVHDPHTVAVGIDGVAPLAELKNIKPDAPVVFELSSWRLEALEPLHVSPTTAVVTSLYRDHLNTYASFTDYIDAKKTIIRYQKASDRAILNADDPLVKKWAPEVKGKLYWYSLRPLERGLGIFVRNSQITQRLSDDGSEQTLFPLDHVQLTAIHQRRNLLPAILLGTLAGMPAEQIMRAINSIVDLPHRLEKVRFYKNATYINDSAATIPDATIAALNTLGHTPLVHILGGSDKKLAFAELAVVEAQAIIRALIFLPGTATNAIKAALAKRLQPLPPQYDAATMDQAVKKAVEVAQAGDIVLLSPGATSFGLFQHEFDRGDQFRRSVLALP